MKNLIVGMIIILTLYSCDMTIIPDFWDIEVSSKDEDFFSNEYNYYRIYGHIRNNFKYSKYNESRWKQPQESYNDGFGDCEDEAILFLAIVNKYKHKKGKLALAYDEKGAGHAYAILEGKSYNYNQRFSNIVKIIEFDDIPYESSYRR